jgi:hypothetical protein
LSAAVVHGVLSSRDHERAAALEKARVNPSTTTLPAETLPPSASQTQRGVFAAGVGGGRAVDYDASVRVRVRDVDQLGERTRDAMRIARSLGGYVTSVDQSSQTGRRGEAVVVVRVPVAHVEDALARLGALGTVLEQHVSIVDLQQTLDAQRRRIASLRVQIVRLMQALRQPGLTADVRLRLQLQLEQARGALAQLTRNNKATLREAALSEISLTMTTQRAAAAVPDRPGRLERAARNAVDFLAAAGAVALFVLIAVSPLIVLVAAWTYGSRAYRRREERRLLAAP